MTDLLCCLCMYEPDISRPNDAVTVIRGYAVCDEHLGYVAQGIEWTAILQAVRHRGVVEESGEF